MKISELQVRQGNVDVVAEVVEKGDVREFQKFGRAGRVCTAKVKDDSGEITLTLWNEDIDKVSVGDKIKITNGYVSEWQGEPQLTTGKLGKLEIAEKVAAEQPTEEQKAEKPKSKEPKAKKKKKEEPAEEEPEEEIGVEEEEVK